jgi:thiamine biosynthesis lipoprotein
MDKRRDELGRASWEAFGTSVVLQVTSPLELPRAQASAQRELEAIDLACSRFRADSELSRINLADGRGTRISDLLMEALELSLEAAHITGGDIDPTIGRALELAGYDRDWTLLRPVEESLGPAEPDTGSSGLERPRATDDRELHGPARQEPIGTIKAFRRSDWRTVKLDRQTATVRVPRGIHLDLGATAKAWASDRAARAAAQSAGCGVLVSIGGDIATSGHSPSGGWRIHVTDDHRSPPTAAGQTVSIRGGGLATSSTTVRRWRHSERTMHHIIDPRTGAPTDSRWRTVSVAAASCAEANIATTAAIVRGSDAVNWLSELRLPARLVDHDGHVFTLCDWPREDRP